MDMIIVWALEWWYGAGWKAFILRLRERLAVSYDYFSIGLLLRTLFAPFRQISAGKVSGPLNVKWQAFLDRTISRVIGAFVRTLFIVIGSVWMLVQLVIGIAMGLLWPVVPFVPFIGFVLTLSGWVPVWP